MFYTKALYKLVGQQNVIIAKTLPSMFFVTMPSLNPQQHRDGYMFLEKESNTCPKGS